MKISCGKFKEEGVHVTEKEGEGQEEKKEQEAHVT